MKSLPNAMVVSMSIATFLVGCGMSEQQVSESTKRSMQQTFDIYAELQDAQLKVTDVQVLKRDGNRYQGIAKIVHEGAIHEVPVEMTVDGSNVLWKTERGAFMFVRPQAERTSSPDE
jgi:hypothetical protein